MKRFSPLIILALLAVLFLLTLLVAPFVGPVPISARIAIEGLFEDDFVLDTQILLMTRLPRVLFGLSAGAALALAGLLFQALLRNDLADPYSLGVANASAVGALVALKFLPMEVAPWLLPISAFAASMLCVGVLVGLSRLRGPLATPASLLLAGVTLSFLFGAVIMMMQYLSDPFQTALILRWLMGGLGVTGYIPVMVLLPVVILSGVVALIFARALNILTFGDEAAHHLGVAVGRTRLIGIILAALLSATTVAYAGPIGFVGLIVPHILRMICGADHRVLVPASLLGGGVFLVICDGFARTAFAPIELPVGILTAFLGSPFFLWLLIRRR